MSRIVKGFNRFFREEDAPTMVEYGLLVVVIALVVVVAAQTLGTNIAGWFSTAGSYAP
jgi:pilus assembly protein Flp/PilA